MQRECRRLVSRPLYLFCMVIAPLFCYIFFTTLMDSGLPKDLPAGVVDMDDSSTSRNIVRNLDAFSQTGVVAHYSNVTDARIAVQEGKIYGFFYIPKGLSAEAQSQRQPKISFYTNYSYLIGRFPAFQRYENDGGTDSRLCHTYHAICQRSYGRSGYGISATYRDRYASVE